MCIRDSPGGVHEIGHQDDCFAYDNEKPRHRTYLNPFRLASRPVTNGEYLAFMEDGGYGNPGFWLSDGWSTVKRLHWSSPLYWESICLLYTSDAADDLLCVDLGGR